MTASNYDSCLKIILKEEGGNSDDPQDHGGRTSRGITQREFWAYQDRAGLPHSDVWAATDKQINEIYKTQYWDPYCDKLPPGMDLSFFDYSVNAGRQQAVKDLQRALGVSVDGMMGLLTLNAVQQCEDLDVLIHAYMDRRRVFYRALKQFSRYGNGWLARVARIEKTALAMANSINVDHPIPMSDTVGSAIQSPKASPQDVKKPPMSQATGVATTTGAAAAGGIVNSLQNAAEQLTPLQDAIIWVKYILAAIAVVSLGLTLYAIWHDAQTKQVVG